MLGRSLLPLQAECLPLPSRRNQLRWKISTVTRKLELEAGATVKLNCISDGTFPARLDKHCTLSSLPPPSIPTLPFHPIHCSLLPRSLGVREEASSLLAHPWLFALLPTLVPSFFLSCCSSSLFSQARVALFPNESCLTIFASPRSPSGHDKTRPRLLIARLALL